jgi:TolB-like protein/DNA-binding winged helix-turn-helix (wHTH) protein/Tfp pilus assembly protein PilF
MFRTYRVIDLNPQMANRAASSPIRFGVFELDVATGELRKSGVRIKLEQQPLSVLLLLLDHPGEIVTRDQLRARLWPDGVHVDFDRSLNKAVVKLRESLGDLRESPRFIETKPRQGYRFIAPVEKGAADRPEESPVGASNKPRTRVWIAVAAALTVLAAGSVAWRLLRPVPSQIRAIAVLPLRNLSGDPAQEYFADGMTEALTNGLAQLRGLTVIAHSSVMSYREASRNILQIARALAVDAVVEGGVERSGDRVRITVQLIDGTTAHHRWARSYDRNSRDTPALNSDIARAIAEELEIELTPEQQARMAAPRSVDPAAQEAFLLGDYSRRRGGDGIRCIQHLQEAIARDPAFAAAYAAQAECYPSAIAGGLLPANEGIPRWRAAVTRATELDGDSAAAHHALGRFLMSNDWNWRDAEREYQTALRLNPNLAPAHGDHARLLAATGRVDDAVREQKLAVRLDPLSFSINGDLAQLLLWARRPDEALELSPTLATHGSPLILHLVRGSAYEEKGNLEQAILEFQWRPPEMNENQAPVLTMGPLGHAYAIAGKRELANHLLAKLMELYPSKHGVPWEMAVIYTGLGDKDRAFEWLEKGYSERPNWMFSIKVDPRMDPLRSDPRYKELLRRMGLPQ